MIEQSEKVDAVMKKLEHVAELPTLPHIASTLLQMVYSSDCSIPEIGKVIERDPALAANVLKVVNSPLFGVRQRIVDISKALVLLGIREIVNLVSGLVVFRMFDASKGESAFLRKDFWLHSAGCAVLSRSIAKAAAINSSGEEFVAGLLHDIGKILLDQYFPKEFARVVQLAEREQISMYDAEKRVLDISHPELGRWIAKKWNLPRSITDAIAEHHAPENAHNPVLVSVVHSANLLCKVCNIGYSGYSYGYSLSDDIGWRILQEKSVKLAEIDLESFIEEAGAEIENAREFLRISAG